MRTFFWVLMWAVLHGSLGGSALGQETQAYDLAGLTFGHNSEEGMLVVGELTGRFELLAGGQSRLSCEIDRVEARGLGAGPKPGKSTQSFEIDAGYQQRGSSLEFANRSLRAGLVSTDGELLALLATREAGGSEAILALGRRQGSDATAELSGEYLLRSFYIALPDAAVCVSENWRGTLSFADDGQWRGRYDIHRAEWDFEQTRFAEVVAPSRTVQGTYQVKADGRVSLGGSGIDWTGFVARHGKLLVLTESNAQGRGLVLAIKAPQRATDAKLNTTHNLLGASLEFEGKPHLAPVLVRGTIAYTPDRHAIDATMEKLKWPGFPRPRPFAREVLAIRPRGLHRVAANGTFGAGGDGSDWHLLLPDLGLSIYMMDFDIFAGGRAESVRGMLIGFGGE